MRQFDILDSVHCHAIAEAFRPLNNPADTDDIVAAFDDMDDGETSDGLQNSVNNNPHTRSSTTTAARDPDPPESRLLSIPSNWDSQDNCYRVVELQLRIRQASKCLQALRDTIADKSFQFSHVIRVAPRKGVRTRARTAITKLNHLIAYYAQIYGHCQQAMARLDARDSILDKY